MRSSIDEDLELELRALPGVLYVGMSYREGGTVDGVTLSVRGHDLGLIRQAAEQIASLYYSNTAITVEDAAGAPPVVEGDRSRVVLVGADFDELDGISQVRLSYDGSLGIGRSSSGPVIGGAEATLEALRSLGYVIPFYLMSVTKVDTVTGWSVIVTCRSLANDGDRIGIARSEGDPLSAAKATLDALNRYVTLGDGRQRGLTSL